MQVRYRPTPTLQRFHNDDSPVRGVCGPIGSGKSVGCLAEVIWRAQKMPPCKDGVRRSRTLIARRTYSQLKSTTIETFNQWFGAVGTFKWDSPIRWTAMLEPGDGSKLEIEILFMSLEGPIATVENKLRSLELTCAFVNEAPEVPIEIITAIQSRLGRYPAKRDLPDDAEPFFGLWMDANPPSIRSWWYEMFEVERPKGWKLFRQPGALMLDENGKYVPNPEAENIENLPKGYDYYLDMVESLPETKIRSLILGEYSSDMSGKPVYPRFSAREHVAEERLQPPGRVELIVGCDWGLNPAAVVTCMTPHGALWVLDEIAPHDVPFDQFRDEMLIPLLTNRYRNYPVLVIGDPSGNARSAVWSETVFSSLRSRGIAARPAWTNDIETRINAVAHFLEKRKGFLLDPSCQVLREGFEGGYHYQQRKVTGAVYADKPEKNEYSHVHDALQYAALFYYADTVRDQRRIARMRRRQQWDQYGDARPTRKALV